MTHPPPIRQVTLAVVPLLFVIACLCPAIDFGPQRGSPEGLHGVVSGIGAFVWGGISAGILASHPRGGAAELAVVPWLANPLVGLGWILLAYRRYGGAVVTGLLATTLGGYYLVFPWGRPLVGAYLWVASSGVLTVGAVAAWLPRAQPTTVVGGPEAVRPGPADPARPVAPWNRGPRWPEQGH